MIAMAIVTSWWLETDKGSPEMSQEGGNLEPINVCLQPMVVLFRGLWNFSFQASIQEKLRVRSTQLLPLPLPDDSDLGRRKGSKSIPEVEEGIVCRGGPGVLGVEEDLPLVLPMPPLLFARLCFLYLT